MERWAAFEDTDLVALAKRLNRDLIARTLALAGLYEDAASPQLVRVDRAMAKAAETAADLRAVRYELSRRRIPNPNGAVNVTVGKQINADSQVNVGTMSGGAADGVRFGD